MSELVKFVRNKHGQARGVLVATRQGIGWSAVHPRDTFDKERALQVAFIRAEDGTRVYPPSHIRKELPGFRDRATRYFRRDY